MPVLLLQKPSKSSEAKDHVQALERCIKCGTKVISNRFIPAITGGHICNDTERKLLSLPTRFGGLAIPIFYEQAAVEYSNSRKLTAQLAPLINLLSAKLMKWPNTLKQFVCKFPGELFECV